jgi:amino acid adenylation domain-containing protein
MKPEAVTGVAKTLSDLSASERAALVMRLKKKPAEQTPEQTIQRRKESGPVPLSFAQQRLWFLEQMGYSNYYVSGASRLNGVLDVKALERSLNEIVQRHEVLRTTFTTIDGEPRQIVAPRLSVTLPVLDLSQLPSNERAAEAARLRLEASRPFNLQSGPLLRTSLLRIAEDEHWLLLTTHHIVSDGWSLGVLFRELATLYESFVDGKTPSLPELPIQYADFALWQRRWLSGEVLERQMAYWKEQLSDTPPVLDLPTDLPRPAVPTIEGSFYLCGISKELTDALKNLSRREGVSLYMTLLAAFKILLARYAGQDDVAVGTPIANRNRIETESLIGFFVNTLVLRTDLSGNPPFTELLKQIREVTLGAFAHQDMPFEKLVEELQPERDITRTPFFQVMFSLQNAPVPAIKMSQVTMALLDDEVITTSQFDLTFDSGELSDGRMECLLEYNTNIFERATVQRMLTHYTNLLESIVANPQQRIRQLPMLTDDERRQILVEWNATARDYPHDRCIQQLFEAQAERTPDAVAVVFGEERVTYAELNRRANQLGHYLKRLGVGPETRVGILLERSVEMPVALLAVLKAGGAYVAFDPSYPPERLLYMFEDSDVSVLLTQEKVVVGQPAHRVRIVCLEAERSSIEEHDARNVQSDSNASNLAYLVYTSGSTGRPKGILVAHRSVVNASYGFINNHRMTERDRLLQFASLSFDVSAEEFFATWFSGGCIVMRSEQTLSSFAEFTAVLQRENISIANLPASFWLEWLGVLADQGGEVPKSVRRVIVGNEKSLEETLAKWQRLIGPAVEWRNAYGPSETTITCSNYEPSSTGAAREEKSAVPIGRPVNNVQMYVLDSALQIVTTGVAGELYIGGDGVARGYNKQPAQTAERFLPNPYSQKRGERFYQTGDAVRFRADGNIEFLGRVDEQIKIRGFRIEPGEIEAVLAQHAGVRESVVVAGDDGRGGQRLIAYVVSNNGNVRTDELREFLQQRLTEYMVPSIFVILETLPRTPNGKVDRRALPNVDTTNADEAYIAPRSATERTIANIWQEVLKVEQVGINDNFFGLGGHSLLLVHAQSKVSEALRVNVSMIEMFKYPTISALAEHLSEQRSSTPASPPIRNQAETRVESLNRQRQLRQRTLPR